MQQETWRQALAENLTKNRRDKGLTQAEVGAQINYSDKSVSKWERGDGVPDLSALMQLSELYDTTPDALLGCVREEPEALPEKKTGRIVDHTLFLLSMVSGIWLLAVIAFCVLRFAWPSMEHGWLAFIYALPMTFASLGASFLVWRTYPWAFGALSAAVWTLCLSLQLTLPTENSGMFYVFGGVLQLMAMLVVAIVTREHWKKKLGKPKAE